MRGALFGTVTSGCPSGASACFCSRAFCVLPPPQGTGWKKGKFSPRTQKGIGGHKGRSACRRYFQTTGRRISYEYAMIDGVNDSDWQADLLARLLKGTPGHVNLIPLNDVEESPLKPSRRVAAFQRRLEGHGVTVTVRR